MAMPRQGRSAPGGASSRDYTLTPERLKLRSSCHRCVSSKLKCSQEKPTCSRCAKRGLTCEYLAAKKGGRRPNRKPASSQSRIDGQDIDLSTDANNYIPQANWFAPSSSPGTDALGQPEMMHPSPGTSIYTPSNLIQDLFCPMEEMPSSASPTPQLDFGDYFSSPVSFAAEIADLDMFGSATIFPTEGSSDGPIPTAKDVVSDLFTVSTPTGPLTAPKTPSLSSSKGTAAQSYQELPHSCLTRALRCMEQISSMPFPAGASAILTVQAIIARNRTVVEAVGTLIECACSQDGYVLAVMPLIIFKVLDWYAVATRRAPSLHYVPGPGSRQSSASEHAIIPGSYCLDWADAVRMAAQLVLGELYLVRRLVEQLSSKLKEQAAKAGRGGKRRDQPESLDLENETALPLSAEMYDHLTATLARRLKALSLDIVDQLGRL